MSPDRPEARGLRAAALVGCALVFVAGAAYPLVAGALRPGLALDGAAVVRSAGWAAGPTAALLLAVRWAGDRRLPAWAALVGTFLVLALGLGLYAAALRPEARPGAAWVALSFVPLRQLAAAAFVGWAVWLARRTR